MTDPKRSDGTRRVFPECVRCQGNGELVTDWDRYLHAHPGDVGDEAVADCPDCDGQGVIVEPSHADR